MLLLWSLLFCVSPGIFQGCVVVSPPRGHTPYINMRFWCLFLAFAVIILVLAINIALACSLVSSWRYLGLFSLSFLCVFRNVYFDFVCPFFHIFLDAFLCYPFCFLDCGSFVLFFADSEGPHHGYRPFCPGFWVFVICRDENDPRKKTLKIIF